MRRSGVQISSPAPVLLNELNRGVTKVDLVDLLLFLYLFFLHFFKIQLLLAKLGNIPNLFLVILHSQVQKSPFKNFF